MTSSRSNAVAVANPLQPREVDEAFQEVASLRQDCEHDGGGTAVLRCVRLCAIYGLVMPNWLVVEFDRRYARVVEAKVRTWDEAFGRPWPGRVRLTTLRRRGRLRRVVYLEVCRRLREVPRPPLRRSLFEEIGEMAEISRSGAEVERLYYEAIKIDGLPGALQVLADERAAHSAHHQVHDEN